MHSTSRRRNHLRRPSAFLILFGLLGLAAAPAGLPGFAQPSARAAAAASFVVNSSGDGADSDTGDGVCNDGSGKCTLRAAVQQANQLAGADTITFSFTGTILLSSALPELSDLTITGPGPAQLTVRRDPSASALFRVFKTAISATVNISGLTVSGGNAGDDGGGIYTRQGTNLTLSNVVVSGNAAGSPTITSGAGRGGGIFNEGASLTIVNSTVSDNSASDGDTFGSSGGRDGGGIYTSRGTLTVTNSTISGNRAGDPFNGFGPAQPGRGGGLFISSLNDGVTLTNTTVSGNRSGNSNVTQGGGIFKQSGSLTLDSCTVVNNSAPSSGSGGSAGGIVGSNTVLRNTIVANNTANSSPDLSGNNFNSQDFNLIENTSGATFTGTTTHNVTGVDPQLGPLQNNGGPTLTHAPLAGSPALDAGDSGTLNTDQRGLPRPFDIPSAANASDGADIGAFEAQAPVSGEVQFSSTTFAVSEGTGPGGVATEGVGMRTVSVSRSASAGAASVDYSTSDGTASSKGDYTTAAGTLHFADGEATKTFQVLVTDDRYDDDDETVNITLSNPVGMSLSATAATAVLTITDNDAASGPSPVRDGFFDTRFFVRQHYLDFLGREPDQDGIGFWSNGIDLCGADQQCHFNKRVDTSAAFFLSIEFQETGFLVQRMYKTAYGEATGMAVVNNVPTQIPVPIVRFNEFLPDSQRIARDVIVGTPGWPERLAANKAAFALEFVSRTRFTSAFAGLTPEQFVDRLITNAGITMDDGERQALITHLTANNNAAGRAFVLQEVAEDEELVSIETNKAFVLMQYFGYLRRNPNDPQDTDHSGYNFWLQKLNGFNGDWRAAQMVEAFLDSIEYKQRFGQP